MWNNRVEQELGRRVHRLVAWMLATGGNLSDLAREARELFAAEPLGGSVATSVRNRCVSLVRTYLTRCAPIGWSLVGVEEQLPHSRIDLLLASETTGLFVGEELKKGRPTMMSPDLADQLRREFTDLHRLIGDRFGGLRVVTLGATDRCWMLVPHGSGWRRAPMLPGLEVR